jgi:hypothetical protein
MDTDSNGNYGNNNNYNNNKYGTGVNYQRQSDSTGLPPAPVGYALLATQQLMKKNSTAMTVMPSLALTGTEEQRTSMNRRVDLEKAKKRVTHGLVRQTQLQFTEAEIGRRAAGMISVERKKEMIAREKSIIRARNEERVLAYEKEKELSIQEARSSFEFDKASQINRLQLEIEQNEEEIDQIKVIITGCLEVYNRAKIGIQDARARVVELTEVHQRTYKYRVDPEDIRNAIYGQVGLVYQAVPFITKPIQMAIQSNEETKRSLRAHVRKLRDSITDNEQTLGRAINALQHEEEQDFSVNSVPRRPYSADDDEDDVANKIVNRKIQEIKIKRQSLTATATSEQVSKFRADLVPKDFSDSEEEIMK